jgi:DNA ligase-1
MVAFGVNFQLLRDYCGTSVESWFLSPKFDGWRVMVSGGRLVTRGGNFLDAPAWFTDGLPDGIDAELWPGLGNFHRTQGMMRGGWRGLQLMVFDAVMDGAFRKRLAYLKTLALPSHVEIVPQVRCRGTEHLLEFADAIVANGGEGAVVRNPRAMYCHGRTDSVLRWVPCDPAVNRRKVAA